MDLTIKELVEKSQSSAQTHATQCTSLLLHNQLAEAIAYCTLQGIEPPQCSLTADSPNAHKLREKAKDMLSDIGWWKKRLKTKTLRDFEQGQINAGHVTQGISDTMFDYKSKAN